MTLEVAPNQVIPEGSAASPAEPLESQTSEQSQADGEGQTAPKGKVFGYFDDNASAEEGFKYLASEYKKQASDIEKLREENENARRVLNDDSVRAVAEARFRRVQPPDEGPPTQQEIRDNYIKASQLSAQGRHEEAADLHARTQARLLAPVVQHQQFLNQQSQQLGADLTQRQRWAQAGQLRDEIVNNPDLYDLHPVADAIAQRFARTGEDPVQIAQEYRAVSAAQAKAAQRAAAKERALQDGFLEPPDGSFSAAQEQANRKKLDGIVNAFTDEMFGPRIKKPR